MTFKLWLGHKSILRFFMAFLCPSRPAPEIKVRAFPSTYIPIHYSHKSILKFFMVLCPFRPVPEIRVWAFSFYTYSNSLLINHHIIQQYSVWTAEYCYINHKMTTNSFAKNYFNSIISCKPMSSKWYLLFRVSCHSA